MKKLVALLKWIGRGWPVLVPIALSLIHVFVAMYFSIEIGEINKSVSLVFQILGGCLVLYSIDSNIGLVNQGSLRFLLVGWVKDYPCRKRTVEAQLQLGSIMVNAYAPNVRITTGGNTVEERIQKLQQQIDWIKEDVAAEKKQVRQIIKEQEEKTSKGLSKVEFKLGDANKKIEAILVGGIKAQIVGVYLMIHGAVAGYLA